MRIAIRTPQKLSPETEKIWQQVTVIETTDAAMAGAILRQTKDRPGVTYIRLSRKNLPAIYEPGSTFEIGKGNVLRDGKDVTFIVADLLVAEALKAAEELEKEGISAAVIDMFTIKPLDEALTLEYAKKTSAIVTFCRRGSWCGPIF